MKNYLSEEHKKAISQGMRKKFDEETDEERAARQERRKEKAYIKNLLYNAYIEKKIKLS